MEDLSQRFATSEVTIRKDLAELERGGVLLRRYGGAISLPSEILAEEVPAKVSQRKLAIAQAAIQHIQAIIIASSLIVAVPLVRMIHYWRPNAVWW